MLREFRVNCADAPAADFKAEVELKTGHGCCEGLRKEDPKAAHRSN